MTNQHLEDVYQKYWSAFETFRRFPHIKSMDDNEKFCNLLRRLLDDHLTIIPSLTIGIVESSHHLQPQQLDKFMERMLRSRISRRVLAEQHIALSEALDDPFHFFNEPARRPGEDEGCGSGRRWRGRSCGHHLYAAERGERGEQGDQAVDADVRQRAGGGGGAHPARRSRRRPQGALCLHPGASRVHCLRAAQECDSRHDSQRCGERAAGRGEGDHRRGPTGGGSDHPHLGLRRRTAGFDPAAVGTACGYGRAAHGGGDGLCLASTPAACRRPRASVESRPTVPDSVSGDGAYWWLPAAWVSRTLDGRRHAARDAGRRATCIAARGCCGVLCRAWAEFSSASTSRMWSARGGVGSAGGVGGSTPPNEFGTVGTSTSAAEGYTDPLIDALCSFSNVRKRLAIESHAATLDPSDGDRGASAAYGLPASAHLNSAGLGTRDRFDALKSIGKFKGTVTEQVPRPRPVQAMEGTGPAALHTVQVETGSDCPWPRCTATFSAAA